MVVPVKSYANSVSGATPVATATDAAVTPGLNLYLIFVISWFTHLPARVQILGYLHVDLVLVLVLAFLAMAGKKNERAVVTPTDRLLRVLIIYAIVTIPFVEWPGSVVRHGIPEFIKAIVFYYFTVAFVRTEVDLRRFIFVFLACQTFRILEPLYLHLTQGYWGDFASMANWEYLDRLSGAPNDIVNPNGLAFIICTVLPFLYFLSGLTRLSMLAFLVLAPACLYVLALTGSRSGFVALIGIFLAILVKSKQRFLIGAVAALALLASLPFLSADLKDRYLSVFGAGEKNESTVELRIEGIWSDFQVALGRPVVGHGLGTSREANANFGTRDQPAHNLYVEVLQELGFVGLMIYLAFMKSIFDIAREMSRAYPKTASATFLPSFVNAMQVFLWMNLLFSIASFGLSSYEWYLFGGHSVVLRRLASGSSAGPS